jgi:hypothetical protein
MYRYLDKRIRVCTPTRLDTFIPTHLHVYMFPFLHISISLRAHEPSVPSLTYLHDSIPPRLDSHTIQASKPTSLHTSTYPRLDAFIPICTHSHLHTSTHLHTFTSIRLDASIPTRLLFFSFLFFSILHCLTHSHTFRKIWRCTRPVYSVYTPCTPSNFPSNPRESHQTLPAPPVSGLQQLYQRFLPPPELPAVSTVFNLLQTSIPTRPPNLHTHMPSRPPDLASMPA